MSVFYKLASFRFFTWLQFAETAISFWFVKGWQISGVQMASMVIVLFEVITFKGIVLTFLHLELLFPKVSKAVVRRYSLKKVFLKISQNSQENTCARDSFLIEPATLLKKDLWYRYFPVNFAKFLRTLFFREHLRWLLQYCHIPYLTQL